MNAQIVYYQPLILSWAERDAKMKLKKHKESILVAVGIFVALFLCYLIGQNIVLPRRMKSAGYTDADGKVPAYSVLENFSTFALGGEAYADVPGSKTISKIEFTKDNSDISEEWLGNCIFMLPDTSFAKRMKIGKGCTKIDFEYGIYPDITTDVCDGVDLIVEVYLDEDSEPVVREEFNVQAETGLERAVIDISNYAGKKVTIGFSCEDGGNDNKDGDWMMIKYPVIE